MPRYEDLLRALPRGSFYANEGYVLPFRDDPQEFLFEDPAFPSQVYGVFVDNSFRGTVTSDAQGSVVVDVTLDPGPHEVAIENDQTARRLRAYVTVRDYAVWFASYAEALEGSPNFFGIDPAIASIERGPKLRDADSIHIEDVHGRLLQQPNDLGYITDSYRTVLQGLRQAFRLFSGKPAGIAQAVAAYTNSLAFRLPRQLRPRWFLGSQLNSNPFLDNRTALVTSQLPNLNQVSLSAVGSIAATALSATPTDPPSAQRLIVVFPVLWDGGTITVTGTGPTGLAVSEVFTNTGPVVGSVRNRVGAETFATVTSITNSSAGTTGTATIGLTENAFIRVVALEGSAIRESTTAPFANLTLNNDGSGNFSLSYGNLAAGNNDNRVAIPVSGRYRIPYRAVGDRVVGNIATNYDISDGSGSRGRDRLHLNISGRGPITCVLGTASGSLTTNTPSNLVTDINNIFVADPRYPIGPATLLTSVSGVTGEALRIDSLFNPFPGEAQRGQVEVLLDCADASRELLGLPRYVGDSTGLGVATDTDMTYTPGDSIGLLSAPFTARVGRGIIATGVGSITATLGRPNEATFSGAAINLRVGECVRITSGANAGLHRITGVTSPSVYTLRHESPTGTFTTAGSQNYQGWSLGDVIEVTAHDPGTQLLTFAAPGLPRDLPSGFQVELNGEVPFRTNPDNREAESDLVVDVDVSLQPITGGSLFDSLELEGGLVPDGWLVAEGTNFAIKNVGLVSQTGFGIERGANDIEFQSNITRALEFKGFPIRAQFWVEQHNTASQNFRVDVSFDGGSNFDVGTVQAVAGTQEAAGGVRTTRPNPTRVARSIVVPNDATSFIVRLVHLGSSAGERITVERVIVTSELTSGLYLANGTIVRSDAERNFGEVLYVWSPEDLTAAENAALGITANGQGTTSGKIDLITPAHITTDRFDVSEYDGSGNPLNVLGAYDDTGWLAATLTNMEVVVGVPGRLTYARPTRVSEVPNELLAPDAFGVASLTLPTTHLGPFPQNPNGSTTLTEDAVPVPDTADASGTQPYVFDTGNVIDIDNGEFSASAEYRLTYDVLMSAETEIIDLSADFADYLWFVDAYVWRIVDQSVGTRTVTTAVQFDANFVASLNPPSNLDKNSAVLIEDDGVTQTEVAFANFDFDDQNTLSINAAVFNPTSLYTLTYESIFNRFTRTPDFTLQVRSAATQPLVATATYADTTIDAAVDNSLRYHQLRILLFGVENTQDIRVHSLGLRGLRVFGSTPNAPGIILP
jgi:hypothetical protein